MIKLNWWQSIAAAGVLSIAGLAGYEYSAPVSNYYTYYGNIPTQDVFVSPQRPNFFTFGESDKMNVEFHNSMWCHPLGDSNPAAVYQISERFNSYTEMDFQFVNPLPSIAAMHLQEGRVWRDFGAIDRAQVRGDGKYLSWSWFADIKPEVDSRCYINAKIVGFTRFFGFEKITIENNSGAFTYIVSQEY